MDSIFHSIIDYTCDSILHRAPFLAGALHSLDFVHEPGSMIPHTDGKTVFWDSTAVRFDFSKNESSLRYRLLHILAHCMLDHLSAARDVDIAQALAFDVIASRFVRSIDPDSFPADTFAHFGALEKVLAPLADPEQMTQTIRDKFSTETIGHYAALLQVDTHSGWRNGTSEIFIKQNLGSFGDLRGAGFDNDDTGTNGHSKHLDIILSPMQHTAFAEALECYTEMGEIAKPDRDSFDIPLFLYSQNVLDVSLIEDTEFCERRKLRSFVIAIDTSGSCARGLTQRFLEATRDILTRENMFFDRFHLRIIQCDDQIRDDANITSPSEFDQYIRTLRVYGGGGTDFRPVFDKIDSLITSGELPGLRGMLYFSDGKGIFPNTKRTYGVTFACPEGSDLIDVPNWIKCVSFKTFDA